MSRRPVDQAALRAWRAAGADRALGWAWRLDAAGYPRLAYALARAALGVRVRVAREELTAAARRAMN